MSEKKSIGAMTILNIVGAVIGVINSIVVVQYFGVSREIEVYFAAIGMQMTITGLMQTGQLAEAFLPAYMTIREDRNKDDAFAAFSVIVNWMLLGAAAIGLLAGLLAYPMMRLRIPGFESEEILQSAALFRVLIPVIGLQVAMNMFSTLANAEKWFGYPEAIGVGSRVLSLIAIIALVPVIGIWALVVALWIGVSVGLIAQVLILRRLGFRHRFIFSLTDFKARSVFINLIYTLGYTFVTQFYSFAIDAALSSCNPGVFAIVRYVQMLYAKVRGIILRPVSTVYFTRFASALAEGAENLRQLSQIALNRTLFVCAIVIALSWCAGEAGLALLWGSSRFSPDQIHLAAFLLGLMLTSTLVQGWAAISRKTAVSMGLLKHVYVFGMVANAISASFVWIMLSKLSDIWVMIVVVAAPILLQVVSSLPLVIWKREYSSWYAWGALLRWSCSILTAYLVIYFFCGGHPTASFSGGRTEAMIWTTVFSASAIIIAGVSAWILGLPEPKKVVSLLFARLSSSRAKP